MLDNVRCFEIPRSALETTRVHLVRSGLKGQEAFVLFSGLVSAGVGVVRSVIYPPQKPIADGDGGVGVYVEGRDLFDVTKYAALRNEILLGQAHSHPGHAYHSTTDDQYPMVSLPGAFSVVVPNFARAPIDLSRCACYRCLGGKWVRVFGAHLFKVV